MTATLTDQRHIVLSPDGDEAGQLAAGQEYHVMISTTGVITLRPKKIHQMPLVEHLRGQQGLVIDRRRDPIPQPFDL